MRISLVACYITILVLLCPPVFADDVQFDGGWLRCTWSVDLQYLTIHAVIEAPSTPGEGTGSVTSSPVPEIDLYEQGQPISHRVILQRSPDSNDSQRIVLSYTLMRVHDETADEFVRFASVSYDLETGIYSYMIDTSELDAGLYRLLIGSFNSNLRHRIDLRIIVPIG